MKKTILLALVLLFKLQAIAQCGSLPPPGADGTYAIDFDNDGYATFDLGYFIEHRNRPNHEQYYGVSSSGYITTILDRNYNLVTGPLYTNVQIQDMITIDYEYSGSGPMFQPQPPCFWPVDIYLDSTVYLLVLRFDGDYDQDGIRNADEDTNGNGNPMDDDADNDGFPNFQDQATLNTTAFGNVSFNLYPNPVSDGTIHFTSAEPVESVVICDVTGKIILRQKPESNRLDVSALAAGMYFFEFKTHEASIIRKVQVR